MNLRGMLGQAFGSILSAWTRSVIALFGITVGIGSVIAMITMGEIVAGESLAQFRELGTDLVTLSRRGAARGGPDSRIEVEDVLDLALHAPGVAVAATWMDTVEDVRYVGVHLGSLPVVGVTEAYAEIGRLRIGSGRFVSDLDYRRPYCVVGVGVAAAMRRAAAARVVGEEIRVLGRLLTVAGVLEPVGPRDFLGLSAPNRAVFLPITTMMRGADTRGVRRVVLRSAAGVPPERAAREAVRFLRGRVSGPLELKAHSARQLIEHLREQTRLFTVLLGVIGGISLVVGGAGVMNLMLISVSERRGEIGLRRAVGARRRDIAQQFVGESVLLCLTGGVLGIGLGVGLSYAICLFTGLPFSVSARSVVLGILTSTVIGVFFGLYPARRAAHLDPMAALRG